MMKIIIGLLLLALPLLAQSQDRIIIAGGSLTEIVYALGAGDRVIAVDQTSGYPPQVGSLPQIGYWKQLNTEGILSLKPDLFITWSDAEPNWVLQQLAQQSVNVSLFKRIPATVEQLCINISQVAEILDLKPQGERLIADIKQKIDRVTIEVSKQPEKVRVLFLLSIGGGSPQIAGQGSIADGIITLAGGTNAATHSQYKQYSGESIIATRPDIIVVTKQSMESTDGLKSLEATPGVVQTPAWRNQRIVAVDQATLLGMGPRVAEAVDELYRGFYPAAAK